MFYIALLVRILIIVLMYKYKIDAWDPNGRVSYNFKNCDYPFPHDHDYWEFLVILNGSCEHQINGKSYRMNENDCCIIRPEDYHMFVKLTDELTTLNIMFPTHVFKEECAHYSDRLYEMIRSESVASYSLPKDVPNRLLANVIFTRLNAADIKRSIAEEIIFSCILNEYIRSREIIDHGFPLWFNSLIEQIISTNHESWGVSEIVEASNFSHTHLNRIFNQYFGMSISQYVIERKMDRAAFYLVTTNDPVSKIAERLGYNNMSNFNHCFKKFFAMSPLKYRFQGAFAHSIASKTK